jgi:hypothetical protein
MTKTATMEQIRYSPGITEKLFEKLGKSSSSQPCSVVIRVKYVPSLMGEAGIE